MTDDLTAENMEQGSALEEAPLSVVELGLDEDEKAGLLEALIFANGEPIGRERLLEISRLDEEEFLCAMEKLREKYADLASGFELTDLGGRYQFRTRPVFADFVRQLKSERPRRLTGPALETLAIIAYRQPIVKSDIEKLRGVDATPTLKTLLERNLVRIVGHLPAVGQPAVYGTTDEFLKIFGIASLTELPTLRDLKELEDPGEVEERAPSVDNDAPEPVDAAAESEENQPALD